jgi:cytochrome b subunit of formate dehydrogenase
VRATEPERVVRHRLPDRLYHWTMAAAVLTLLGTGFLPILGWKFEWVTAHWIAGLVLAALVAWHIVRAAFWLDFWSMVVGLDDMRSGGRAVGQVFGRKGPPPLKPGKYSLLQKLYHLACIFAIWACSAADWARACFSCWVCCSYVFSETQADNISAVSGITRAAALRSIIMALSPCRVHVDWAKRAQSRA